MDSELYQLVTSARDGDLEAYAEIVHRFQDMAFACAHAMLHDHHLAEDATQMAFVLAYQKLATLKDERAFPGWFRRIVLTCAERVGRKRQAVVDVGPEASIEAQHLPGAAMEQAERHRLVMDLLLTLPLAERRITTLFYISSYSQAEIARFLEISVDTVKNRLRAARKKLKAKAVAMMEDELKELAPSQQGGFATNVINLIRAAGDGDVATIEILLKAAPEMVNAIGDNPYWGGRPQPLHMAVTWQQYDVVKLLLDRGADVNGSNDEYGGWSPLMLALDKESRIAELLIEHGAEIGIFEATMLNQVDWLKARLEAEPELARSTLSDGMSLLHVVRTAELATLLLERGADIHQIADYGNTALQSAIQHNRHEVAAVLIENGAAANVCSYAALGDLPKVKALVAEDPSRIHENQPGYIMFQGGTPLHAAITGGHWAVVKFLVDSGADIHLPSVDGAVCPIHSAAGSGHVETIKLLLEKGADPNARDGSHNGTALDWARFQRHERAATFLAGYLQKNT